MCDLALNGVLESPLDPVWFYSMGWAFLLISTVVFSTLDISKGPAAIGVVALAGAGFAAPLALLNVSYFLSKTWLPLLRAFLISFDPGDGSAFRPEAFGWPRNWTDHRCPVSFSRESIRCPSCSCTEDVI